VLAPHDPNLGNGAQRLLAPGAAGHLLGTDDQGRDLLSRLLWGGRFALVISIAGVVIAMLIGTVLGLVAAFAGRRLSGLLMRVVDLLFAFPVILVALSLAAVVSAGPWVLIGTIVFSAVPYVTRIVFGAAKIERNKEYVEAARSLGASGPEILRTEVLPNIGSSILIYGTSLVGVNVVFTASLSALGLGIQPPNADWGRMISEGAKVLVSGSPAVATFPALAILLVALAFNWLGDGLRDVLEP
jgi:peptide/nickel transport system permease protein